MGKTAFGFAAVVLCGLGLAPLLVQTDPVDASDPLSRSVPATLEAAVCNESSKAAPTARCAIGRATALADAR